MHDLNPLNMQLTSPSPQYLSETYDLAETSPRQVVVGKKSRPVDQNAELDEKKCGSPVKAKNERTGLAGTIHGKDMPMDGHFGVDLTLLSTFWRS